MWRLGYLAGTGASRRKKEKRRSDHADIPMRNGEAFSKQDEKNRKPTLKQRVPLLLKRVLPSQFAVTVHTLSKPKILIILMASFWVLSILIFRPLNTFLFGDVGAIRGGKLGVFVDYQLRKYLIRETIRQKDERLQELGVTLPEPPPIWVSKSKFPVITNVALGEVITRAYEGKILLGKIERLAETYEEGCQKASSSRISNLALIDSSTETIPRLILRPSSASWAQPYGGTLGPYKPVTFYEADRRQLIKDRCGILNDIYTSTNSSKEEVEVWTICALYWYGGVFIGEDTIDIDSELRTAIKKYGREKAPNHKCIPPVGVLKVGRERKRIVSPSEVHGNAWTSKISFFAATPRHPYLLCVMKKLATKKTTDGAQGVFGVFGKSNPGRDSGGGKVDWLVVRQECADNRADKDCCGHMEEITVPELGDGKNAQQANPAIISRFIIRMSYENQEAMAPKRIQPVTVIFQERDGMREPRKAAKEPLQERMIEQGVQPSWLCNRCLRTALYGTFEKCSLVCNIGYEKLVCPEKDYSPRKDVFVDVSILGLSSQRSDEQLIPRIIHQTYFEELTPTSYPHLVRLQNTWRNTGWDYRFYTDESARKFIERSYPTRFLDAFDALVPGAYKADLFRYLVLLKEGGVYADVDVMLDANLDNFITNTMSFFAPRDLVGEYAAENFCLWNGLIGSTPGHPFLLHAVERTVNLVLNRADLFDMEKDACVNSAAGRKMDDWKVRAEPGLLLSGPCALGVAVNSALGNEPLANFDVGWLKHNNHRRDGDGFVNGKPGGGDTMILVADKRDLGALRHSDPERNIIVATTDMAGLFKDALNPVTLSQKNDIKRGLRTKEKPHYSTAALGQWVWGSKEVYKDTMVNNERIRFHVSQ